MFIDTDLISELKIVHTLDIECTEQNQEKHCYIVKSNRDKMQIAWTFSRNYR